MVSKLEEQSPTMPVGNYLKRSSSFEGCATESEAGAHNSKKAREENTPDTPAKSKKSNKRKGNWRVRFSLSENKVFEVERPTREEKINMHMTKEDQRGIIEEVSNAIRRADRDDLQQHNGADDSDSNKFIEELGIERILQQQEIERTTRVKSAICVILQRQLQARLFRRSQFFYTSTEQTKIIDENWLEKHYRPFSKKSSDLARSRGLQDQEMAPYLFPRKIVMSR